MKKGKVVLVGAGPGDKSLLTIKGAQAINDCNVIVYDALVSEDIMGLIPDNVEKINVGKRSGNHLLSQKKINELLLLKALEGKYVVRLKGGILLFLVEVEKSLFCFKKKVFILKLFPALPQPLEPLCMAEFQ